MKDARARVLAARAAADLAGVRATTNPRQFVVRGATSGTDAYALIMAQVAACKAAGGGAVLLPYIGGAGYSISQTIVVDFDDCTIFLDDNVMLTKTDPTNLVGPDAAYQSGVNGCGLIAFLFSGILQGPRTKIYINRPQLIALRQVTINGNGLSASSSYTYTAGAAGWHAPVVFRGTRNALIRDVRVFNGLVGCVDTQYSPEILIDRVIADTTQYDNGIQVAFNREHVTAYSDADPTTWANATIRDCIAMRCRNHGIGSYGAVNVNVINPVVIACGNNGPARQTSGTITDAGPAGGINFEHDGTNTSRNYRGAVTNPKVFNSWGFGIRTNQVGTEVIGGRVAGTKVPTDATYVANDTGNLWGSSVFVQGAATCKISNLTIDGSEKYGVRMAVAGGLYPSAFISGGQITGCLKRAIFGQGIAALTMSPDVYIFNNGNVSDTTAGDQFCIALGNGADNTDAGLAQIAGRFENNYGGIVTSDRVGNVDLTKGISGKNNGIAWGSANFMVRLTGAVQSLHAANINLDNTNGKAARIGQVDVAVRAFVDRNTIIGEQTSTVREPFEIVAVTNSIRGSAPRNQVFPSFAASFTPNSANGESHTFSNVTGNMTINANSPSNPPLEGQTITFVFIQDATGGRSITWNAAWKGATLTGPGTAGQRAVVTFRYSATNWYQVANTGWVS